MLLLWRLLACSRDAFAVINLIFRAVKMYLDFSPLKAEQTRTPLLKTRRVLHAVQLKKKKSGSLIMFICICSLRVCTVSYWYSSFRRRTKYLDTYRENPILCIVDLSEGVLSWDCKLAWVESLTSLVIFNDLDGNRCVRSVLHTEDIKIITVDLRESVGTLRICMELPALGQKTEDFPLFLDRRSWGIRDEVWNLRVIRVHFANTSEEGNQYCQYCDFFHLIC